MGVSNKYSRKLKKSNLRLLFCHIIWLLSLTAKKVAGKKLPDLELRSLINCTVQLEAVKLTSFRQ